VRAFSHDDRGGGTLTARFGIAFSVATVVLVAFYIVLPAGPAKALSLIAALFTGFGVVWNATKLAARSLSGAGQFGLAIAVLGPALVAMVLYLLRTVPEPSLAQIFESFDNELDVLPIAFICLAAWLLGNDLNRLHPFGGFLVAFAVISVVCYFKNTGGYADAEVAEDFGWWNADAWYAQATGESFGQFILYISAAYIALFARMIWRRRQVARARQLFGSAGPDESR